MKTLAIVLSFCIFSTALAQSTPATPDKLERTKLKKKALDTSRALQITYQNSNWNKNSTQIDSGTLILRDKSSGQIVKLELQENAPDSAIFVGIYIINWANIEGLMPEIYSSQDLTAKKGQTLNIKTLIESGDVTRKPYIVTKDERGLQNIDVFETKNEAERALTKYTELNKPHKEQPVPTAATAVLEAEKLASIAAEKLKLENEARRREAERRQLEEAEKLKTEEKLKEQQALNAAEKEKRQKEAKAFAEAAMDAYRVSQFKQAEEYFQKSIDLDPENKSYYYQFGVTLYRNDKFNKSLVYLKLAQGQSFDPVEKDFYLGLNHYKLKEYSPALKAFQKVEATKHDPLGPSASFYIGLVHFSDLKYEEAKIDFQRVLDTSNDPKLDERAEDYMEQIDRLLFFAKNKTKQFIVTLNAGPQYDSNILLVSDATSASGAGASSEGSPQFNTGASLHYRPIYEKSYEFGAKAKTSYLYTTDTTLDDYDTWSMNGSLPFVYKGLIFGKGLKAELIPAVERLYIGQDAGGAPQESLNSTLVDSLNTIVVDENWFTSVNIKYRGDTFSTTPTANATKLTFGLSNTLFLNKTKSKAGIFDLAYTTNNAVSDTSKYSKVDLGVIYLTPWIWDIQVIGGLALYMQSYSLQDPARSDTNMTASITLARPITEWLKAMWNTAYISNSSNITTNTYKKYISAINIAAEYQF